MVSPMEDAGADEAMPMIVSCATPMASGSSLAAGGGVTPATAAGRSICSPSLRPPAMLHVHHGHSDHSESAFKWAEMSRRRPSQPRAPLGPATPYRPQVSV